MPICTDAISLLLQCTDYNTIFASDCSPALSLTDSLQICPLNTWPAQRTVLLLLIDVLVNVQVEDDSLGSGDIAETGYQDETGEMRRPWCPATRLLEHREAQAQEAEAEARSKAQQKSYCNPDDVKPVLRDDFPSTTVCASSVCN